MAIQDNTVLLPEAEEGFAPVNKIQLHYIRYAGEGETIIMLHGLTANAHAFDGLVSRGLYPQYTIVAPDMRGRGLSSHPAFCYTIQEHAEDIIGLLDHLGLKQVVLAGHSFGGLLSFYLAAVYPERISKVIILDAAAEMNPNALQMLGPALGRLDKVFPSFEEYLDEVKHAPYNTFWDDAMLSYYRADVMDLPQGKVTPRPNLANIIEVSVNVGNTPWDVYISRISQPVILLNALDEYTMGEPLLPDYKARETVEMMAYAQYIGVDGNHQTMLYGDGAKEIVKAIRKFVG
ncbi:alpha/beta fold hydrolase [Chitinophagaceae bacterium MMS25-I14]